MKSFFLIFFLFAAGISAFGQDSVRVQTIDSAYLAQLERLMIQMEKEEKARKVIADYERLMLRREMSFSTTGMMQFVSGIILSRQSSDFRNESPRFTDTSDDWRDYTIAFLPVGVTYATRLLGVQSKSNTNRLLTSTALGFALSAGLSSGMKNLISERRPDWSDDHSMPSRHAAMAFTAATILHREYGYVSPWVSVGGYATATATQFIRLNSNAHWLNDMFIGATIGTVSANLGYFITDRIFKEKGLAIIPKVTKADLMRAAKFEAGPTSFCMVSGNEFGLGEDWECERTFFVGGELAYFFNEFVAGEGILKMSSTKVSELKDNLLMYHADAALRLSCPIKPGFRIHARAICGGRFTEKKQFVNDSSLEIGGGLGFDFLNREKYSVGLNADYCHVFSDILSNRLSVGATYRIIF
ncbi:MAG: phosphatase PAP2 family protein [Bacteroidaceae bacterium]|nr:phosphatase PAP2 family protein [Bacteroidaceae bacterium]